MPVLATDPPVSEKQRKAMWAAREGRSTLGIPKSVGEKFVGPGHDAAPRRAAGVLMTTDSGLGLFLRRGDAGDHPGEWGIPGGGAEGEETPEQTARREAAEETGFQLTEPMQPIHQETSPEGVNFVTFHQPVDGEPTPTFNEEHTDYAWAPLNEPPEPLHPGVAALLAKFFAEEAQEPEHMEGQDAHRRQDDRDDDEVRIDPWQWAGLVNMLNRGRANDAGWEESKHPRGQPENAGEFAKGGGGKGGGQPSRKEIRGAEKTLEAGRFKKNDVREAEKALGRTKGGGGEKPPTKAERISATAAWRREVAQRQAPIGRGAKGYASGQPGGPLEKKETAIVSEALRSGALKAEIAARSAAVTKGETPESDGSEAFQIFAANAMGKPPAKRSLLEKSVVSLLTYEWDKQNLPENAQHKLDPKMMQKIKSMPSVEESIAQMEAKTAALKRGSEGEPSAAYKTFVANAAAKHPAKRTSLEQMAVAFEQEKSTDPQRVAERKEIVQIVEQMLKGGRAHDEALAFDRATARTYDKDGRLHVDVTNISKSNVSPYLGREIPDWDKMGLDPDKTYRLLRDPAELARAAPTFNNLPLLDRHVAVTADSYPGDLVIGSTGTDAQFAPPYLRNSLVIWKGEAIKDVNNESKKELSSAYRYRADMTPGVYQGEPYDGVMRDIVGNHVALVKEGRVGSDVVVGDAAPRQLKEIIQMSKTLLSRKATLAQGALAAFLLPRLAQDAKIDLAPVLRGLTDANFKNRKAGIIAGIKKALDGKLAKDAKLTDEELVLAMDALQDIPVAENPAEASAPPPPPEGGALPEGSIDPNAGLPPAAAGGEGGEGGGEAPPAEAPPPDPAEQVVALLQGKVDDETLAQVLAIIAPPEPEGDAGDPFAGYQAPASSAPPPGYQSMNKGDNGFEFSGGKLLPPDRPGGPYGGKDAPPKDLRKDVSGKKENGAMDAKAMDAAVKVATDAVIKNQNAIREAERFVRPWVGEFTIAHDSAEAVYRSALKTLAVDGVDEVKELAALRAILKVQPLPGAKKASEAAIGMDAAQTKSYNERFPEAARIGNLG